MKTWLTRAWDNLFPLPSVTARDAFILRLLLAVALFWFFPPFYLDARQPEPVGLAHWFDLTWISAPGVFAIYRAVFFFFLLLLVSGFALPVTLPLVTLMHILPATLHNSQGFTFHGNQIMSLTLLGLSVMSIWLATTRRMTLLPKSVPPARWALMLLIVAALSAALFYFEKQYRLTGLGSLVCASLGLTSLSADATGWVNLFVFIPAFIALAVVPSLLMRGAESADFFANGWFLLTAQFVIAGAYLISVFSKFIRSDGMWLFNSHYVALDFVKTLRQNYYSSLDPQYAADPPAYVVMMMNNPFFTAIFFDIGVLLETAMIFLIGHRKWTCALGIVLIFMHYVIAGMMNLFFPTHVAMLTVFWVLPWLLMQRRRLVAPWDADQPSAK